MSNRNVIQKLIDNNSVASVLKRGSSSKDAIRALQNILYELGFGVPLNWEKYGADGGYGGSSTAAVKAFAGKNGITSNGETVTEEIARKLIARYDVVDDLQLLYNAVEDDNVEKLLFRGAPKSLEIVALQTLLNEIGYGAEQNWEKYGADGYYGGGATRAVKALADKEGISSDGTKLTKQLAERIINKLKGYYGDDWSKVGSSGDSQSGNLKISETVKRGRTRVIVTDGEKEISFVKFKKGVYTFGRQKAINFVKKNRSSLNSLGLTDSALNVMIAVSENEGNLDAINTWDNSFMTFGMFQWTIGARNDPGELPALIKKIKAADVSVFNKYYGQFGLDIVDTGNISGYFTLDGKKIDTAKEKELFRTYEWSFYFWCSGQDSVVQSVEIQHAMSRIDTFYKSNSYKVDGYYIADLVTSEYGVGLLLDNHVNRPGYIKGCLKDAMKESRLSHPKNWSTTEERKLIEAYLKIRETYGRSPMTHASKRAAVTKKYLDNGTISDERGSFKF